MKVFRKNPNIFSRIFATIIILIIGLSFSIGLGVERIYKNYSHDNLTNSNYALLRQIDTNMTTLFDQLLTIVSVSDSSVYFRNLLTLPSSNQVDVFRNKMDLHRYMSNFQPLLEEFNIWITLIGDNGIIYTTSGESFTADFETLSQEAWFQELDFDSESLTYTLDHKGLNSATEDQSMTIYAKNLINSYTMQSCGALFLEISSTSFDQIYKGSYLKDDYIFITDSQGRIISSNDHSLLDNSLENFSSIPSQENSQTDYYAYNGKEYIALKVPINSFEGYIVKLIDLGPYKNQLLSARRSILLIVIFFILLSIIISYFLCQQISSPIKELSYKMSRTKYANTPSLASLTSATNDEVEILNLIYENLLDEIDQYTENLVQQNKARRTAEFNALQMQINPHFLYNTLASVKIMILNEPNKEKTVSVVSSLIELLRNTISNPNEFVTLKDELKSLENYINLQNVRYEDKIQYDIICFDDQLLNQSVPKLLLQPIVENAIFHGFKDRLAVGNITIYITQLHDNLKIEIIDDGCGMDQETVNELLTEAHPSTSDCLSGIGIKNINNRIKLLYGDDYGVVVTSSVGIGSNIRLILPLDISIT